MKKISLIINLAYKSSSRFQNFPLSGFKFLLILLFLLTPTIFPWLDSTRSNYNFSIQTLRYFMVLSHSLYKLSSSLSLSFINDLSIKFQLWLLWIDIVTLYFDIVIDYDLFCFLLSLIGYNTTLMIIILGNYSKFLKHCALRATSN